MTWFGSFWVLSWPLLLFCCRPEIITCRWELKERWSREMGLWPFIRFLEVSNNHTRSKASLLVASRLTDKYWWLWNAFAFDHLGHDESNPRPLSAIRPRCMVKSCYFQKHIFTFVWWSSWILFTTDCIFNIQRLIHHTGGDESYIRIWQVACDPWSILPVVGTGDPFWGEYLQKYHQRWR